MPPRKWSKSKGVPRCSPFSSRSFARKCAFISSRLRRRDRGYRLRLALIGAKGEKREKLKEVLCKDPTQIDAMIHYKVCGVTGQTGGDLMRR